MLALHRIMSVALVSQMLVVAPVSVLANQCNGFYSSIPQSRSVRASIPELIAAKFKAEPHGYPDLLISDVLMGELAHLQKDYQEMIEVLSTKDKRENSVTYVLESTNNVLAELARVSRQLDVELGKEKRRDESAISSLSKDLERCQANVMQCRANLPLSIRDSAQKINEATQLVAQLNERASEVERIIRNPVEMQSIPLGLHESMTRMLGSHKELIARYVDGLNKALTIFKESELLLRGLAPELVAAEYDIAMLQSKGAHVKDALAIASSSKSGQIAKTSSGYPNFAKLFEKPVKDTAFGRLLRAGLENFKFGSTFYRTSRPHSYDSIDFLMKQLESIKKVAPGLERRASAREVREFILSILRNPKALTAKDSDGMNGYLLKFVGSEIRVSYDTKEMDGIHENAGDGKKMIFNFNYLKSDLHLPLMFIEGNGPHLFKESLIWLAETIESVRDEVSNSPRSFRSYFSTDRNQHITSLNNLAKIYRDAAKDGNFITQEAQLLDYNDKEISGVFVGWEDRDRFVVKSTYEF